MVLFRRHVCNFYIIQYSGHSLFLTTIYLVGKLIVIVDGCILSCMRILYPHSLYVTLLLVGELTLFPFIVHMYLIITHNSRKFIHIMCTAPLI